MTLAEGRTPTPPLSQSVLQRASAGEGAPYSSTNTEGSDSTDAARSAVPAAAADFDEANALAARRVLVATPSKPTTPTLAPILSFELIALKPSLST